MKNFNFTTLSAWMVVVGLALGGFSLNTYFKNHPLDAKQSAKSINSVNATDQKSLEDAVLPQNGYEINADWGNIGPTLIKAGVIDIEKFKAIYAQNGGLSQEELEILEKGANSKIKITHQNSRFVLNMLWAFGLAQENRILTEGDMVKYNDYKRFASTGGWSISSKPIDEFYSKFDWLSLNVDQQEKIKNIAENIYRPCCNNSTAFPDCNHGMAALGLIEIMVSSDSSEEEIYKALKYFNSFWFSSSYLEIATYFKQIKGIDWEKADAKEILSKKYSSGSGWAQNIHAELEKHPELLPKVKEGGGCGV